VSYTKGELVKAALSEIGIADYEFDITPGELASGIRRLNSMMSQWSDRGVRISFNYLGASDDDSSLPSIAEEAVISNLALRLASSYGKQVAPEVRSTAKRALNSLYNEAAYPNEMQLQTIPIGAGFKTGFDDDVFFVPKKKNQWRIEDFDDYSGGTTNIQVGDSGTAIRIAVSGDVDLSTALSTSIRYRKPDGVTGEWPGTVVDGAVEYITVSGDIDQAGVWYIQAFFELPTWQGSSKVISIRVGESIDVL
jgi:hypothetical protein